MQQICHFFYGGDWNPFAKEAETAYKKLTEERRIADPSNEMPDGKVFPKLDSWPDYVIAESKSTFWKMERAISRNSEAKATEIETLWKEAQSQNKVDKWLESVEADEAEKAMCFYMRSLHELFAPNDKSVDFRLYITESGIVQRPNVPEGFSLEAYEG